MLNRITGSDTDEAVKTKILNATIPNTSLNTRVFNFAQVIDNNDPENLNRIKCRIPVIDDVFYLEGTQEEGNAKLPWSISFSNRFLETPEVNSIVLTAVFDAKVPFLGRVYFDVFSDFFSQDFFEKLTPESKLLSNWDLVEDIFGVNILGRPRDVSEYSNKLSQNESANNTQVPQDIVTATVQSTIDNADAQKVAAAKAKVDNLSNLIKGFEGKINTVFKGVKEKFKFLQKKLQRKKQKKGGLIKNKITDEIGIIKNKIPAIPLSSPTISQLQEGNATAAAQKNNGQSPNATTKYKVGLRGKGNNRIVLDKDFVEIIQNYKDSENESSITLSTNLEALIADEIYLISNKGKNDIYAPVFDDPLFEYLSAQNKLLKKIVLLLNGSPAISPSGGPCMPGKNAHSLIGELQSLSKSFSKLKKDGSSDKIFIN